VDGHNANRVLTTRRSQVLRFISDCRPEMAG
jgi:hypothetical protein